jgi:hypothetical protein
VGRPPARKPVRAGLGANLAAELARESAPTDGFAGVGRCRVACKEVCPSQRRPEELSGGAIGRAIGRGERTPPPARPLPTTSESERAPPSPQLARAWQPREEPLRNPPLFAPPPPPLGLTSAHRPGDDRRRPTGRRRATPLRMLSGCPRGGHHPAPSGAAPDTQLGGEKPTLLRSYCGVRELGHQIAP